MKALTLYARRVKQGTVTFYETAIAAGNLTDKDYYDIDTWNQATGEGYQREQNPSQVRGITNYLSGTGHSNVMPQNIVVNSRLPLKVEEIGNGIVKLTLENWPAYVIDGQHRINGVSKAIDEGAELEDYEFGVTVTNFSIEEEMVHFRNLNYKGIRPPKGLGQVITSNLATKYGWAPRNWSEQAVNRAVAVTIRLANDPESPWYGKIALGGIRKRGYHTTVQSSFVNTLEPLFVTGRFADPNEKIDHVYELVLGFWKAVEKTWPEAMGSPATSLIQRPSGFAALNRFMGRIFGSVSLNADQAEIEEMLAQVRDNLNIDDIAWGYSAGFIRNLRMGYSENKANGIVADYLWGGIRDREAILG